MLSRVTARRVVAPYAVPLPSQPRQPANGRFMKRPYEKIDAATITP